MQPASHLFPSNSVIPLEQIERKILLLRGQKVLLDADLAVLYGVSTKRLNEQVRRNQKRFPADFVIELTTTETNNLRSQFVTSKLGRGGRRYGILAFTEQGVAMLSSVLNSQRAVQVNIAIMRAFVQLRELLATNKDLAKKLDALEKKYDGQFQKVFAAIRALTQPDPPPPNHRIGFGTDARLPKSPTADSS